MWAAMGGKRVKGVLASVLALGLGGCLDAVAWAYEHVLNGSTAEQGADGGALSDTSQSASAAGSAAVSGSTGTQTSSSGSWASSSGSLGTGSSSGGDGGMEQAVDLEVGPTPLALEVNAAVGGLFEFAVTAVLSGGMKRTAYAPIFRSESPDIGQTSGSLFIATGVGAGVASVRVRAEGIEKVAFLTVRVVESVVDFGESPDLAYAFGGSQGDGARRPNVVYPLRDVVIPTNLSPITVQWVPAQEEMLFRVRLSGTYGQLDTYTSQAAVLLSESAWMRLLNAHVDGTLTLTVEAVTHVGADRHVSDVQEIRLAGGPLAARVTYFSSETNSIMLTDVRSATSQPLGISGNPSGTQQNCYSCHAVSVDGRRMALEFYNERTGPGVVLDPSSPDVPLLGPSGDSGWTFSALSPDHRYLLTNHEQALRLMVTNTGQFVSSADPLATEAAHPAWSPTGDSLAYASDIDSESPIVALSETDFETSDLTIRAVDPDTGQPGAQRKIDGGSQALFHPAFSPDGRYLVFNRGGHSRSAITFSGVDLVRYPASLEMVDLDVQDPVPVTLSTASPGLDGYAASFAPSPESGYWWMVLFSRRDYGQTTAGSQRRQIWIAAVDTAPSEGSDPSHPPFWLPAQNSLEENLLPRLSAAGCRDADETCLEDSECCAGSVCRQASGGESVCVPESTACHSVGQSCTADKDCCDGQGPCFDSGDGVKACVPASQQCKRAGELCTFHVDCCSSAAVCVDSQSFSQCAAP
jgi:hypothetical protein